MSRHEAGFRHESGSRRAVNVWMVAMAVVLAALCIWVVAVTTPTPVAKAPPHAPAGPTALAGTPTPTSPPVPTRADIMRVTAPYFGLSAPNVPWSTSTVDSIAKLAGRRPTMLEYFVNWTESYDPAPVRLAWQQNAVPVVTWEPWAGEGKGESQPKYALSNIIGGQFDKYIAAFAGAVRDAKWPIVLRFAHEMNGNWYPWSESQSGNGYGQYVKAWRHVHDIFTKVAATNVVWVWSPNIIRPLPDVSLKQLFPGAAYVDWVGFVGYGVNEETASVTFDPTIQAIRKFSNLPILITETGARPGPDKTRWTADFFTWLAGQSDVVGFVWFQYSKSDGGTSDWRFNSDPQSLAAFTSGLAHARLADPVSP